MNAIDIQTIIFDEVSIEIRKRQDEFIHKMLDTIEVFIPHKIISSANTHKHWTHKWHLNQKIKWHILVSLQHIHDVPYPCIITFTRSGPRNLDEDNLLYAFKGMRDYVADFIVARGKNEPIKNSRGRNDADQGMKWKYDQVKGPVGFWIKIEALHEMAE